MRFGECPARWLRLHLLLSATSPLCLAACHGSTEHESRPVPDASACEQGAAGAEASAPSPDVLTQHNDAARTGATLAETSLDTCNVGTLVQQGEYSVDGELYAQPLYVSRVATTAGMKNLLIVATMNDSLFAFDADRPGSEPIWQLGQQQELGTPALSARNVGGNNGILATPVIDAAAGTVFVVSRDCDPKFEPSAPHCQQRLFAIDVGSGRIKDSVVVSGYLLDTIGFARTVFDPNLHWSRSALLLLHDQLFVSFGSGPNGNAHEEDFKFHGWLFGYSAKDLSATPSVYCSTPGFGGGAIWQSGNGPAADDDAVYFATGNGIQQPTPATPAQFPEHPEGDEDSVVRVPLSAPTTSTRYWDDRPYHADGNVFQYMEKNDIDLGTAGPLLIPGSTRLIAGGKSGILYVLDRSTLRPTQDPLEVFHSTALANGQSKFIYSYLDGPHVHGSPVFFRPEEPLDGAPGVSPGLIFFWPSKEQLSSFTYDYETGLVSKRATADVPRAASGGMLSVSAWGGRAASAIVWASAVDAEAGGGHLWALSATDLSRLWDAPLPEWAKFAVPTIAAGRVYVASSSSASGAPSSVVVFGLPGRVSAPP